jgi:acetolactate decarboxylase
MEEMTFHCMDGMKFFLGIGLAVVLVCTGLVVSDHFSGSGTVVDQETLYQVSTIDALMQGVYDGVETVGELNQHGDFGIGTFDGLDGEMIVLNGVVYQAKADGHVYVVLDSSTTPWATVTYFGTDFTETVGNPMNFSEFSSEMAGQLPSQNMIYAVKMQGTFPFMQARAIPAQQKPYPNLTVAAQDQSVFTFTNATGTVVGFYMPVYFNGLDVPGYHLHFISDDRQTGGHILEFIVPEGMAVEYDITPEFYMVLPTSGDFMGADLSQDMSGELAEIEQ